MRRSLVHDLSGIDKGIRVFIVGVSPDVHQRPRNAAVSILKVRPQFRPRNPRPHVLRLLEFRYLSAHGVLALSASR